MCGLLVLSRSSLEGISSSWQWGPRPLHLQFSTAFPGAWGWGCVVLRGQAQAMPRWMMAQDPCPQGDCGHSSQLTCSSCHLLCLRLISLVRPGRVTSQHAQHRGIPLLNPRSPSPISSASSSLPSPLILGPPPTALVNLSPSSSPQASPSLSIFHVPPLPSEIPPSPFPPLSPILLL